eukprot:scaffold75888_cov29-Tisochrysis_lutea.AAC.4
MREKVEKKQRIKRGAPGPRVIKITKYSRRARGTGDWTGRSMEMERDHKSQGRGSQLQTSDIRIGTEEGGMKR